MEAQHFIGLAAQFHVLAYISAKADMNPSCLIQQGTREIVGLFESAVLGDKFFAKIRIDGILPHSFAGNRRAPPIGPEYQDLPRVAYIDTHMKTVQFLIKLGLEQTGTFFVFFTSVIEPGGRYEWESDSLKHVFWQFIEAHEKSHVGQYGDVWRLLGRGGLFFQCVERLKEAPVGGSKGTEKT